MRINYAATSHNPYLISDLVIGLASLAAASPRYLAAPVGLF
jgi:hypothetical protein